MRRSALDTPRPPQADRPQSGRRAKPDVACQGSAGSFAANEAILLLKLLAFNLAGMLRGELEDASGCGWDLKRVQSRRAGMLRAGARLVQHARRVIVDVARAAGVLWERLLERVGHWWRDETWGRSPPRPRRWVPPPRHAHLSLVLRE